MYNEIEGGSCIEIHDNCFGFVYKCWVPPFGFGVNVRTGVLQDADIIKRSDIEKEQYWERPLLPDDFKVRRKKEKNIQKLDPDYVDPFLEEIRRREWKRRLCGVWIWVNGVCIYITGVHYFMLTYWKFQGKWFDFRITDRDFWYVVRYMEDDPFSLGLNELTKRKNGKTARVGCWLYERTSRMNDHHGGIQSKTDDDAWEVFKKAVVHPWKTLPDFFRPTYDLMKGDDPSDELRLFATSRRGQQAESEEPEEALNSFIDFKAATESAYDGPELHSYVSDESGKTKQPVSIVERQRVVRYCTEIDGAFMGKHIFTTTVEPEKGEEENYEFQEMTAKSNPLDRDDNGRTGTGLYTYFLPAYKGMFFDKYGYPEEERAKVFLLNTRKKLESDGDTRGLSSFKRKNPMNFKEAFSVDGETALFNPELINEQLDSISWGDSPTERGSLDWIGGYEFLIEKEMANGEKKMVLNELEWRPNPKGKYEKVVGWFPKEPNKVHEQNGQFLPNNNFAHRAGCDPFKYDKTKDKRRSNASSFIYQLPDLLRPNDPFNDCATLNYSYREESTRLANMDVLKMLWWCGCQCLFERNVNHWKRDFQDWGCAGFLMWLPGEVEPGIATDGKGNVVQMICNFTEAYINEHIKKVFFKKLMRKETGWLGFKVEDTQKSDDPMGFGFTLIAVKGKKYRRPIEDTKNIESIFPMRKAI